MLSLHAREITLEKARRLAKERQETGDTLAHEFRNILARLRFTYRALNNEIAYLRESWENLIHERLPEQPNRRAILQDLTKLLKDLRAGNGNPIQLREIIRLSTYQQQLMKSCLLPKQNEAWLQQKIKPLWLSILSESELTQEMRTTIEQLLEKLRESFYIGQDVELRDSIEFIPDELKTKWVDLAYREINADTGNITKQYIEFLGNINIELPRKSYSLKNLICLRGLVELIPELEKKLNQCLEPLRNSETPVVTKYLT
jgi:hypothetical protein